MWGIPPPEAQKGVFRLNKKLSRLLQPAFPLYVAVLLFCAFAAFFLNQRPLAVAEAIAALVLLAYGVLRTPGRKKHLIRYLQTTTDALDVAIRNDAPIAKVVLDPESGEILWANGRFCQLIGVHEDLLSAPLQKFLPDLNLDFLRSETIKSCPELTVGSRRYHIYGNIVAPKSELYPDRLANLYFVDMTEFLTVKEEYARSRPVVSIILIDNYDELTNNMGDNDVSALNVAINNAVRSWAETANGLLRKVARNRYLFVFESQYLPGMIEAKFPLLDEMRKIFNNSGVAATVSLGIGKDGENYEECHNFAALSIEMALSRGGDQVVIKDRYNFNFYGARAKETGGRSKVKARVTAGSLSELIAHSSHIFIMGHANADMDSVGAAAGIQAICRKKGKKAHIIVDYKQNSAGDLLDLLSKVPEYKDSFLSGESALIMADAKSLLIVVDTNRPDQVQYQPLLHSMNRVVVIDHHRRAADYIEKVVLSLHEPAASSASELVSELLQYAVDPSDVLPAEAMALMAGIVLDTKHFSVRTSGRTFEAAAFLKRLGADTLDVKRLLQSDFSTTVSRYQVVQKARIYRNNIAISVLDSEVSRVIAAQAADELVNIANISTSFVLFPSGNRIMISARAIGDANVQVILEQLGGGGNPATAGAQIADADMNTVVDRLVAAIDRYYAEISAPNEGEESH